MAEAIRANAPAGLGPAVESMEVYADVEVRMDDASRGGSGKRVRSGIRDARRARGRVETACGRWRGRVDVSWEYRARLGEWRRRRASGGGED